MKKVLEVSIANNGIPLELAFKSMAYETGLTPKAKEEAPKQREAAKSVGPSDHPSVMPSDKKNVVSNRTWRDETGKSLDKFGY